MAKFFRRLLDPREHFRMIRKVDSKLPQAIREVFSPFEHARDINNKVLKPLGITGRNKQQAQEDTAAQQEAARQEADAARQARDNAAAIDAQQNVLLANQQAEDALAKAQRDAPIDRLDIALGGDDSPGFQFRKAATNAAGDPATAARKVRAFFRR